MTNHQNVKRNLLELTKAFPSTLENKNKLLCMYWAMYDGAVDADGIASSTPAETILRNLRRLADAGQIKLPNREVEGHRKNAKRVYELEFTPLT